MKTKIIKNYPNYRIYENGDIEKLSPMARRGGAFMSPALAINGYKRVSLMRNNKSKNFSLHRLIGEHFVNGKTAKNKYINHKDGIKTNNNPSNLEWCDMSYNTTHAYQNGLSKKEGKLTLEHVKTIKNSKLPYRNLAKKFGVSSTAIYKIRKGISYKWV